jgi:cell shape-determining protein MreD
VRYVTGGAFVIFIALAQASSIEQFKILGVSPNLVLVLLVAWLVTRGLEDVLPMIAVAGVTLSLVGLQTPGLVLLALLPIAALGIVKEMHVVHSDALLVLLLTAAGSVVYESIIVLSVMLTGGGLDARAAVSHVIVPALLVNLAITPPVYLVMRMLKPADMRRRLSYA